MIRQFVFLLLLTPLLVIAEPKSPINHPYAAAEPSPSPVEKTESPDQESRKVAENSILRVNSTNQAYDFFQPWLKRCRSSCAGGMRAGHGGVGDEFQLC